MASQRKKVTRISRDVQHEIIQTYLSTGIPKSQLWQQFTGREGEDHGQILRWMRQLGYLANRISAKPVVLLPMSKKKVKSNAQEQDSLTAALQLRIKQLERQLEDSQLTAEAYRRMVQIAEQELKIDIQKKSTTK